MAVSAKTMKPEALVLEALDALATVREQFKGTALVKVVNESFADFEKHAADAGIKRVAPEPPIPDKLDLLAREIGQYLRRFERDPKINIDRSEHKTGMHDYFGAGARDTGQRVGIVYISYQGTHLLTREEAQAYLRWLRAGNVGRHHEVVNALKEKTK
jgi:hypothetical protein